MKQSKFTIECYGKIKSFEIGQKVVCIYYGEYQNEEKAYKRSWLSKLIDKPFSPVKNGTIVGDAGTHPYWLSGSGNEQYLLVKFDEYILAKPIPISCIVDCKEYINRHNSDILMHKDRIGEKGFSLDAVNDLCYSAKRAELFLNSK